MKIALLGGPGAGKTSFARKLARAMAKDEILSKPTIVDGYVEDLSAKTDYALDFAATYPQNMQILFHRWTLEQQAAKKSEHTITCGTLYETMIYCAIHSLILTDIQKNNPEDTIKARTTFNALGMIETELYDYEAIFYLPYDQATIINKGHSYDAVVNQKIRETLEGFNKECVILDGSDRENVKYAHEIIKLIRRRELTEDEERSVRGSGEDDFPESEAQGGMSDVRESQEGDSAGDQGVAS